MLARHVPLFRVQRESRFHYDVWILNDEKRDMLTPIYSILSAVYNSANLNVPAIYMQMCKDVSLYITACTLKILFQDIFYSIKTCALKVARE